MNMLTAMALNLSHRMCFCRPLGRPIGSRPGLAIQMQMHQNPSVWTRLHRWLRRLLDSAKWPDLLGQPIVFLGSEGETAVLDSSFYDYLWLLGAGLGPCEATSIPDVPRVAQPKLESFALKNAAPRRTAAQVLEDTKSEFPCFGQDIEVQSR